MRVAFGHDFKCMMISDVCATRWLTFNGEVSPAAKVNDAFLVALGGLYAQVCTSGEFAAQIR